MKDKSLAIIGGRVSKKGNGLYAQFAFGKIVDEFSRRYKTIILSSPLRMMHVFEDDYRLPENVFLEPQPEWKTTAHSIAHTRGITDSYERAIAASDHVFIRGNPVPATRSLYKLCKKYNSPVCHWLVGNPMALLLSHRRTNIISDTLAKLYIWQWERHLERGCNETGGSLLCNGTEIATRYPTLKTYVTVSTTLSPDDIFERNDTCNGSEINLLCLCYIRPEKGIEYLIEALALIPDSLNADLLLVGSRHRYGNYQQKLDRLVRAHRLEKRIKWKGHVVQSEIPKLMRASDIFVLPTLSEGTPRVLVEARANGLPLIASNVGGIPDSVTDGVDGLLVPPKNPQAIANAISKIAEGATLRKKLIESGYETVRRMTIDKFVDRAIGCITQTQDRFTS